MFGTKFLSWVDSVGDIEIPKEVKAELISELANETRDTIDQRGTFLIFLYNEDRIYLDYQSIIYNSEGIKISEIDIPQSQLFSEIQSKKFTGFEIGGDTINHFIEIINFRCPHPPTAIKMIERVNEVKEKNDSIGGIATGIIVNCPKGIGEPCFDKFEAILAMAMLSLPATKGFEFGSGFEGTKLLGSQHNDMFVHNKEEVKVSSKLKTEVIVDNLLTTKTNNAGGTLGGITNGNIINFRVAVKPVSTISLPQSTSTYSGEETTLEAKGRHDPWVLPRIVPIIEAMSAIVTIDLTLQQLSRKAATEYHFDDY